MDEMEEVGRFEIKVNRNVQRERNGTEEMSELQIQQPQVRIPTLEKFLSKAYQGR